MRHIEDDEDVGSMDDWSTEFFDNAQDHDEVFDEDGNFAEKTDVVEDKSINRANDFAADGIETVDTGSIELFNVERTSEVTGKKVVNYVDNDGFCNAVIAWNDACRSAAAAEKPKPPMPDVIGQQILLMAEGLSRRYNFRNYTYIDEMRDDAVYMAIRAVKNFDPTKSNNAFGYFNRVMWQAMTTRIKTEKDENDIKMSLLKDPMYLGYTSETSDNQVDKDRLISVYDN